MLVGLLAACSAGGPLRNVAKGDELAYYNFSEPRSFEEGAYDGALLRVIDGVYRINVRVGDNTMWWGQWGDTYDNVVIDVDVKQLSERPENAYGVMCRVRGTVGQSRAVDPELAAVMAETTPEPESTQSPDTEVTAEPEAEAAAAAEATAEATAESTAAPEATPAIEALPTSAPASGEGDGYLFLIQGSGSYAIMRARGRDLHPLVNWTLSDVIRTGANSENHLRAVCSGNYLAFYINEQFVADATDDTYTMGQVGLAASAATRLGAVIEFDNLQISQVRLN
jgi:hypothetical protein